MDWLNKAWRFLTNEANQKALAFVGGGIAAVVIGGWQLYTHFAQPTPADKPAPVVTVNGGGVASGEDLHITQTGSGTLNVGGVHGVPPEDFQRVSEDLGVTKAALASFFKVLEKQQVAPEDLASTLRDFLEQARGKGHRFEPRAAAEPRESQSETRGCALHLHPAGGEFRAQPVLRILESPSAPFPLGMVNALVPAEGRGDRGLGLDRQAGQTRRRCLLLHDPPGVCPGVS